MISIQERTQQFKRIRAIEREAYPDNTEEILAAKTINAIIDMAVKQNTLHKEGWLEKYVLNTIKSQLQNSKEGEKLRAKNANLPKGEKLRADPWLNIKPRALKPIPSEHLVRLTISAMPDYQEMKDYFRILTLLHDFDCEVHIPRAEFEAFLKRVQGCSSFVSEVRGSIVEETPKGFLMKAHQMQVTESKKDKPIIPSKPSKAFISARA